LNDGGVQVWTIYERPSDYPGHFVVRRSVVALGGIIPDLECGLAKSLEGARKLIPDGLARVNRYPSDDPVIVESWV